MGIFSDIFGDKVKIPEFQSINIDQEIRDNIQLAIDEAERAGEAAEKLGISQADAALTVLERFLPGTRDLLRESSLRVQEGLRGELPEDVSRLISDRANAQAVGGGFGFDSGRRGNLELRDLGLASLSRIDNAILQAQQLLSTSQQLLGPIPWASNFFLSPQQRIAFRQSERDAQYNRDLLAAQAKAQPDPVLGKISDFVSFTTGAWLGSQSGSSLVGGAPSTGSAQALASQSSGLGTMSGATAPAGTVSGWGASSMYSPASAALGSGTTTASAGASGSSLFGLAALV